MMPWGRDKVPPALSLGRGRGRVRWPTTSTVRQPDGNRRVHPMAQPVPLLPEPMLGPLIQSSSSAELRPDSDVTGQTFGIRDPKVIASYNWLETSNPSILIPGEPPSWTPLHSPQKLNEDSGTYYRDLNAAHLPDHPMQPTIEAVLRMCPADILSAGPDIVACGSTLGNILRFVRGNVKSFRMLVEVVGTTVHLIRREKSPRETIPDVRGYGHTFPEAYTTWDSSVRGSLSHQRIMRYRLNGLDCIVRFECDGYVPGPSYKAPSRHKQGHKRGTSFASGDSPRNVSGILGDLTSSLAISSVEPGSEPGSRLSISSAGHLEPHLAKFELKTRSFKRRHAHNDLLTEEMPRLWLKQVSSFIAGYHTYGKFEDIVIADVQADIRAWETEHRDELKQFTSLLRRIIQFARDREESRFEIVHTEGSDKIDFRLQTPDLSPMLSPDVSRKWSAWLTGNGDDDDQDPSSGQVVDSQETPANDVDSVSSLDYTACDDECGYCGKCST
ncbi:geranylgeranyl pyrophosphate synthetase [Xylariaceae sp. FL1272]|nr:geranylgeranyl pyrophosphate synthetase [Xylariaceae sp. FL1272]